MKTIRIGVVGVGWIAQVVHLPILHKLEEAEVVALCDTDRGRLRAVGEKFGIAALYQDIDRMLAAEGLDAVVVCTSTDAHRDVAVQSLAAGTAVLVERPMARDVAEARQILDAARTSRKKVMVGMNHRFRPDVMILKSFIEAKEIGRVFYTKTGWLKKKHTDNAWFLDKERSGGGVFIDLGLVMLDMALWAMGYPPVRKVRASHFNHTTKKVEDTSIASVSFADGSVMNIEVSWNISVSEDHYFFHAFGTQGTASINPLRVHKEMHGNMVNLAPAKSESPPQLFQRSYENQLKHFIGAVAGRHPVISTAEEAVERMRIVQAIYRSAKLGKEVSLE